MANEYNNPVTRGMSKIEFGLIPPDGGLPVSFFILGYTRRETFEFNSEDGDTTDFYAEESDSPIATITTQGKETIEFDLMNFDLPILQKIFGGRIEGTGDEAIYYTPSTVVAKEWACKITPEIGHAFTFPRVSFTSKLSGSFTKSELLQIHITGTILAPSKEGLSRWMVKKIITSSTDLSSVITVISLGELADNTESSILTVLKDRNPLLDISKIDVTDISTTGARIISKENESTYAGSVNIDFTITE